MGADPCPPSAPPQHRWPTDRRCRRARDPASISRVPRNARGGDRTRAPLAPVHACSDKGRYDICLQCLAVVLRLQASAGRIVPASTDPAQFGLAWLGLPRLGLARLVAGRVLACASRQRNRLGRRHLAWPLARLGSPPPNGLGPLRLSIMTPPACTRPTAPAHLHKGTPGPARLRHKVARSPTRARGLPQRASDARLNSLPRTHTSDLAYMWLAAGGSRLAAGRL